jgi:hypothetical protein
MLAQKKAPQHAARYFSFLAAQPNFIAVTSKLPDSGLTFEALTASSATSHLSTSASQASLTSQVLLLFSPCACIVEQTFVLLMFFLAMTFSNKEQQNSSIVCQLGTFGQ